MADEPSPAISLSELKSELARAASPASPPTAAVASPGHAPPTAAARAPAYVATGSHSKLVAIEALYVEDTVTFDAIHRAVTGLLPEYTRCSDFADAAPQRMQVSAVFDRAGHTGQLRVAGSARPGLRQCLEQASARLVVPKRFAGAGLARWIVRYVPDDPD